MYARFCLKVTSSVARAAVVTPLYISGVWILLITYQMFTRIAVFTALQSIAPFLPSFQILLADRVARIEFLHAFAWIWVMTSLIPSIILKKTSAFLQFIVVFILTFLASEFENIVSLTLGREFVLQLFTAAVRLEHPLLAFPYLAAPYIVIFAIDFYERRRKKLKETAEPET